MIDKIILGLLTKKDLTSYDLKIAMGKSISKFYSNSLGSINPALKKLEQAESIVCFKSNDDKRLKKTYRITVKGEQIYNNWISEPIKQGRFKDEVLIRVFFLGDVSTEKGKNLIEDYVNELTNSKVELEFLKSEIKKSDLSEEQLQQVKFQIKTLQFGIDYLAFKQSWFEKFLTEI